MSRLLRRAALAAALAGTAAVALPVAAKLWGFSARFSHPPSPPQDSAATTTHGHLGLVRAHPGMRELNEALTSRDAFFLDAAHALAAGALRAPTMTGRVLRRFAGQHMDLAAAESTATANLDAAVLYRVQMALLQARDGRFDEALADVARLVVDRPGDPHPRIAAAALCFLHGRMGSAIEWVKSLPKHDDDSNDLSFEEFAFEIVFAMPGSSPPSTQGAVDEMVVLLAAKLTEAFLVRNFDRAGWSTTDERTMSFLLSTLRFFVHKYSRFPCKRHKMSTPPPAPSGGRAIKSVYLDLMFPVECSQAMLASLLRARPLCGERLREARATAERALADAEAEGDDLAAVDVNLVLAFLAARDGDFEEALRRYKAAVQKDPSDCRPYELASTLCFVTGLAAESEAWRRDGRATNGHAALAVAEMAALLDELVVAAALGHGNLTALGRGGQGRLVMVCAWREVDARLAAAVLDKDLTLLERVQLRLLRSVLHMRMQPLLDITNHGLKNSTRERD